jgi:hypothetical protein
VEKTVTPDEYQRICGRLARKAIRYAKEMSDDEEVVDADVACPKCARPVGEPCKFLVWAPDSGHDAPPGFVHNERRVAAIDAQRKHWIDVFLDERLPDVDADVLLEATTRAKAFEESTGRPAPSPEITAFHAFQADVWAAIDSTEPAS